MYTGIKRAYTTDQINTLQELLSRNQIRDSLSHLGEVVSTNTQFQPIEIISEGDKDISYTVQLKPAPDDSISTIDQNEPVRVDCEAYISNSNESWYIPPEEVKNSSVLPELRQAYHEGNSYKDREADYKYHFPDGSTSIARRSPNPIERVSDTIQISSVEYLGGAFPQKWLLSTGEKHYYLRERSGTIKLRTEGGNGELIFKAFVGGEHPGTTMRENEVVNIIDSMDYINIADDADDTVPEEAHQMYRREI